MAQGFYIEKKKHSIFRDNDSCDYLPNGYLGCTHNHNCSRCEIADRYREHAHRDVSLFTWGDALPQTPTGCRKWVDMPVILFPSAMERLKIESILMNQIMVAKLSPGCFYQNPAGEIDGYLFADRSRHFTVSRKECFGVPKPRAAEYYDELFRLGLCRMLERGWCV